MRGLLDANVNKDGDKIDEQRRHIQTVREGWAEMVEQVAESKSKEAAPTNGYV